MRQLLSRQLNRSIRYCPQNKRRLSKSAKDETDVLLQALKLDTKSKKRNVRAKPATSAPQKSKGSSAFAGFFSNLRDKKPPGAVEPGSKRRPPLKKKLETPLEITSFFDNIDKANRKMEEEKETKEPKKKPSSPPPTDVQAQTISTTRSVADLFPVRKVRSPNAFDEEIHDQYLEMMEKITASKRFHNKSPKRQLDEDQGQSVIDWLKADALMSPINLPTLDKAVKEGVSKEEAPKFKEQLLKELYDQRDAACKQFRWGEADFRTAAGALKQVGGRSAKTANAVPLEIAWQKMKEIGHMMDKDMLNNYLFVSSTFSNNMSVSLGSTSKGKSILDLLGVHTDTDDNDGDADKEEPEDSKTNNLEEHGSLNVASESALLHDLIFEPSEQSLSIRVRLFVAQGKLREAETLLDSNQETDVLRLRTYSPVFEAYLDSGNVSAAIKLYTKMRQLEGVILLPETYIQLIACLAEGGHFRAGAPVIEGIVALGYNESSGPMLMDQLITELAEDTVEISSAAAKRLYNAIQKGFSGEEMAKNMKQLHILEPLKVNNEPAQQGEIIASRVVLDEGTGVCPRSGVQLRLINLDNSHKKQLRESLKKLAAEAYEERNKRKKGNGKVAVDKLEEFISWFWSRKGKPFTAIVDGANIAYYMQNYDEGRFSFNQIKFVVDTLEKMGETVLVVVPERYMSNQFLIYRPTGSKRQIASKMEIEVRQQLYKSGKLYVVSKGLLDDYYWMFASVAEQPSMGKDEEMFVLPNNDEGRWPGIRPMLISNDKMRDHKLAMLEPRLFRRWYSNFLVNFTFAPFIGDKKQDSDIGFTTADFYSREIQGNVGDDNADDDTTTWHLPVSDWDENESFCIRIPRKS